MTQVSSITTAAAPQAVAAPLASLADKPFAYVLRGLVEAQLPRPTAAAERPERPGPVVDSGAPTAVVTKHGPVTLGAFALWHRFANASPFGEGASAG
ncbi:hypothetical protein [Cryptosporangium phraense]|uniref:Uncharacterized protein n=1 Tax=Cryptosporangium phraense TaxID=2593070 RepID=A0A545AXL5_9ACTN|nr:hypothetical protein [Cryptosporangium phraense]TQS46072.1 hypothetical protein FL583_06205 [Cryptosporangium phraense]